MKKNHSKITLSEALVSFNHGKLYLYKYDTVGLIENIRFGMVS